MRVLIVESEDLEKKLTYRAHEIYQDAEPNLPRHGNCHHASAVDHVSDRLHGEFGHKHALKYKRIAKKVVSAYADDDTSESRKREKKVAPKVPKASKEKLSYTERVYGRKLKKPIRGRSSY